MSRTTPQPEQAPGAAPFIQGYWAASEAGYGITTMVRPTPPNWSFGHRDPSWVAEWQRGVDAYRDWLLTDVGMVRVERELGE